MKSGFIGLGNLGTPIAINLTKAGKEIAVYNRTVSKTEPLIAVGAEHCDSIAALAKECSIVFTIVSDDTALKSICEGPGGLIANLAPGSIHISMSTILPQTAAELSLLHHQKQQHYLAAPVFGRPEAASAKKLNFVVSGTSDAIRKQVEPMLKDAGAAAIYDFGDLVTTANTIKLCGNFLIASALEAIGESIALATSSGVNASAMWQMFTQTLFNTALYQNYSNIILEQKFQPAAFTAKLGLKDMNLVLQQANTVKEEMPLAMLLKNNMQLLVDKGNEQIDWSAVATGPRKM